jgi:hypothetical protein
MKPAISIILFAALVLLLGMDFGRYVMPHDRVARAFQQTEEAIATAQRWKVLAEGWETAAQRWEQIAKDQKTAVGQWQEASVGCEDILASMSERRRHD